MQDYYFDEFNDPRQEDDGCRLTESERQRLYYESHED